MRLAPTVEILPDGTPALVTIEAFMVENEPVRVVKHETNRIGSVQYLVIQDSNGREYWVKSHQITAKEVKPSV